MVQCIDTIGQSTYLGPAERLFGTLGRTVDRIGKVAGELLAASVLGLLAWQRRAEERSALQALSDEMLRDVGLSRADIAGEAGKPFWVR